MRRVGWSVARGGYIIAAAMGGALVLAGCGATSTPPSTSGPTSTTMTAVPQGSTTATLAIVRCPTTFAAGAPTTTAPLPTSAAVVVPADEAPNLVLYGDDAGIMMLVGPSGWTCRGSYGADGSGGLVISPVGESVPSDPDTGWQLPATSPDEAIVGYETGGSPVEAAELACPLFTSAAAVVKQDLGRGCAVTRPVGETSSGSTSSEIDFEDPAGVAGDGIPSGGQDPANGVVLYRPKQDEPTASLATCTLPAPQHDVCTAVLDHFGALYG